MLRKNYEAEVKRIDAEGKGVAVIATLNVIDSDGDVTQPGAFGVGQTVPIVPAHDWQHVPIGKGTIREEGNEALFDFQLNMKLGFARAWYEHLKFDLETPPAKQQWSYGFSIPTGGSEVGEFAGQRVRRLKRLKVHEVSPVIAGAGIDTRTLALKQATDQDIAELAAAFHEIQHKSERLDAQMAAREFERLTERVTKPFAYAYLPKGENYRIEAAVASFANMAAEDLGIKPPATIRLFRAAAAGEHADFRRAVKTCGLAQLADDSIAVAADLGLEPGLLAMITAHEVAHLAGADEIAAEAFERKFVTGTYARIGSAAADECRRIGLRPDDGSPMDGSLSFEQAAALAQALRSRGLV